MQRTRPPRLDFVARFVDSCTTRPFFQDLLRMQAERARRVNRYHGGDEREAA